MNKTLIVAALAALTAGASYAQSSVTIYGRLNVTTEQVENTAVNGTKTKVKYLNDNASRLGFKGTEDLGGGLRAGFQLEHGFDATNGVASSTFWGRQSEVNLGGAFGTIRLGRFTSEAYFATADYVSMHNHDTGKSEDELYAYIGRNSNKVAYRLPTFTKGLQAEVAVSAGENAPGQVRTYDGAVNYNIGGLALGAGYEKNGDNKQLAVRGLYDMGSFLFGGYIQRHEDAVKGTRTLYRLSGAYMLGSSEFHLNFGHAGAFSKVSGSDAKQFTVAYNYNLSKRTKVYTYYTKLDDAKRVANGIGDQKAIAFGVRHNF